MGKVSRAASGCLLALFAAFSLPVAAGVFWKTVPVEGPLSKDVGLVLGDASRTLAFGGTAVYEFEGFGWHRIRLYASSGAEATQLPGAPFFRAGRFFALDRADPARFRLLRLEGDTWRPFFESGPVDPYTSFAIGATRLYFTKGGFDTFCRSAVCIDPYTEGIRMSSVALGDGNLREEAKLPACSGELYAAGDTLYLRALPAGCAGPSARARLSRISDRYGPATVPLYRLDADHWTRLPDLEESYYGLFTTDHDLWTIGAVSAVAEQIRRLTPTGLTPPVLLLDSGYSSDRAFTEWNGEILYTTGYPANRLYRLRAGAFESVPAPFYGALYAVAGSRLFASGAGSELHLYNGASWDVTPGITGSPGSVDAFLVGDPALFAIRGAEIWRRDGTDWAPLPRPPLVNNVPRGFVFQNRPILVNGSRLLAFDGSGWTDLGPFEADVFFTTFAPVPPSLVTPDEFWVSAQVDTLLRYRDGVLTTFRNSSIASNPPGGPYENHPTAHVRSMDGAIMVFGSAGNAYRLTGDLLVPAFPEIRDYWVDDGAAIDGRTFLNVRLKPETSSPPASLVEVTPSGTRPLISPRDYQRGLLAKQGEDSLTTFGGALLLGGLSLTKAGVLAQRADRAYFSMDSSGLFATSTSYGGGVRHDALLLPTVRVRKVIAASVDTTGVGGRRYRSTLVLANFSSTRTCVAHVLPGAATSPVFDVPLGPGRQVRVENPVPNFVGPLSVDFEGLDDDRDAFAAVRVWNPVGDGTAGATLVGRDSGSSSGWTPLLPPDARAGSRLHLAISAAADGPGLDQRTTNYGTDPPEALAVPSGTLVQVDPIASSLRKVLYVPSPFSVPTDDLLGYFVRNDPGAEDITIVSSDAPGTIPGQLVRFLPAVVSVTSAYATYRTELSLGRAAFALYVPKRASYTATWRPAGSTTASSFSFDLDEGEVLHVPDAVLWLASNGVFLPPGSVEGTLTFSSADPEGASALLVNAVILARSIGSAAEYGTAVPSFAEGRWARARAIVPGLLESDAFRSNLAVANPEMEGGSSVTLSVELRGADGLRLLTLPSVTLRPGERRQFSRPLAPRIGEAYAVVTRVGGEGRFVAYGVVNDNATGSGSLFEMTRAE